MLIVVGSIAIIIVIVILASTITKIINNLSIIL